MHVILGSMYVILGSMYVILGSMHVILGSTNGLVQVSACDLWQYEWFSTRVYISS